MLRTRFYYIWKILLIFGTIPSRCELDEDDKQDCALKIKLCKQIIFNHDCKQDRRFLKYWHCFMNFKFQFLSHANKKMCYHNLLKEPDCTSATDTKIITRSIIELIQDCECYYIYSFGIEKLCPRSKYVLKDPEIFKKLSSHPSGSAGCWWIIQIILN